MTGQDLAKEFSDFVNSSPTGTHEEFTKAVLRDHKTLQQSMIRLCFNLIFAMAEQKYTDDRNIDAVTACKTIVERCKDDMRLRFI